jgi:chaperonin GroEL
METVLEEPYLLLVEKTISNLTDLLPDPGKGHADGQATGHRRRERRRRGPGDADRQQHPRHAASVAVKAPGFGERRTAMLADLAVLTGAQVVSDMSVFTLAERRTRRPGPGPPGRRRRDETTVGRRCRRLRNRSPAGSRNSAPK